MYRRLEGTLMDRSAFNKLVDLTLSRLARAVDDLGSDALELDEGDGKLVIEHEDGTKLIVSRQSAADQLWLAEPGGGWHFDWKDGRWVCDKRGVALESDLERLLSAKLGKTVSLSF